MAELKDGDTKKIEDTDHCSGDCLNNNVKWFSNNSLQSSQEK